MPRKLYGAANSKAKLTNILYGGVNNQAEVINKFYGSASNKAKLIHQNFAHIDYYYGVVIYYLDDTYTTTGVATIKTAEELASLKRIGEYTDWSAQIDGVTVSNDSIQGVILTKKADELPAYFLYNCDRLELIDISASTITSTNNSFLTYCDNISCPIILPSSVTEIGENFMAGCTNFNSPIVLPSGVQSIGRNFMFACVYFNSPVTLPSGLKSIGEFFMRNCNSFNQPLMLPSTLTSIGYAFLFQTQNYTSVVNVGSLAATIASNSQDATMGSFSNAASPSVPSVATGITIAGSNRAAWLSRFPRRYSSPWRKLVDAGY